MSWGVATQNGVSVSLASIVSISCGATEFSPASLFTSGVAGAWYDPSDYSTLFQDSAGTTPVTAVEQPVGLMLDKSQGLVLGSELVTNGDFSDGTTGWSVYTGTLSVSGGEVTVTNSGVNYGEVYRTITTVAGQWYKISATLRAGTAATVNLRAETALTAGNLFFSTTTSTSNVVISGYFLAAGTSTIVGCANSNTNNGTGIFDNISVKAIPGNHASQATSASRPILRARYNLLTYSEQFDNAAWTKINMAAFGSGSIVNATTAPDGTTTADKIVASNTASATRGVYQSFTPTSGATYTIVFYAKAAEYSKFGVCEIGGARFGATFDLSAETTTSLGGSGFISSSITPVGSGWYRCIIVASAIATGWAITAVGYSTGASLSAAGISYAGDGTSGIYLWGADLRTGSSAGTYQRIAAATDYATAGFLPYLALDGTDDSMATGSINFTATDKMSICAGVTKLSDAALGMVAELSANLSSNAGTFWVLAPLTVGASGDFDISFKGTNQIQVTSGVKLAPVTAVITGTSNIAAPSAVFRYNGTQTELDTGSQGTGNFGNYPLYIGRRGGASLPFNGRIYQMVVCGKTLSASELASTEAYVNSKTGAY